MRSLIILGAGTGSRLGLGYNKIFYKFSNNKSILQTTIDLFYGNPLFDDIILVYNKNDEKTIIEETKFYQIKLVEGIGMRHNSAYEGIKAAKNEIIYIHDCARCNFNVNLLDNMEDAILKGYKCVTLGVPCNDTISLLNEQSEINDILKRENLISIQTPQIIHKTDYLKIYKNELFTDESSLFFKNGYNVKIVKGDYGNLKITTKEDLGYYEYTKFIRR